MALRWLRRKDGGGGCEGQGEEGIQDYDNAPKKLRFGKSFFLNRKGHTASLCNFPGPAYRGKQLTLIPFALCLIYIFVINFGSFYLRRILSISHVQFLRGV